MKKINNRIGSLLIGCMIFCGCSDFLTVDIPDELLKEDYWKTRDHLDAAFYGAYTALGENLPTFIIWGDMRSNIYAAGTYTNNSLSNLLSQNVVSTNTYSEWSTVYKMINNINSFLKNAETVLDYDYSVTREEVLSMKGEMYALRALCYFYLVRTFEDVPVWKEPYESDAQSTSSPAVLQEEVLDFIEEDLELAFDLVKERFDQPEHKLGRVTQNAVRAIWADVKLWRGGKENYEACVNLCNELEPFYHSKMVESREWFSMFSMGNSSESIFEYQFLDDRFSSTVYPFFNIYCFFNYQGFMQDIRKAYPAQGSFIVGDTIRYQRTIYAPIEGGVFNNSYRAVAKYGAISIENRNYTWRDQTGGDRVNFIFYRYREILLMKAEALAMLGHFDEALEAINIIRSATELPEQTIQQYGRGQVFFDKLLSERVAELGFEGKQWFSMVRIALRTGAHSLLIDRIASTTGITSEQVMRARLVDQRSWFMPYNKTEVEIRNPELKQKEYYKAKDAAL